MVNQTEIMQKIKQAKKELSAAGWNHICTTMNDSNTKEYGLVYTRNGETFYLNIETVDDVGSKTK